MKLEEVAALVAKTLEKSLLESFRGINEEMIALFLPLLTTLDQLAAERGAKAERDRIADWLRDSPRLCDCQEELADKVRGGQHEAT